MREHGRDPHAVAVLNSAANILDQIYSDEEIDCVTAWRLLDGAINLLTHARDIDLLAALDHGHTQAEYARALGVSKQAFQQKTAGARRRIEKTREASA